jgi:hypothetical protein
MKLGPEQNVQMPMKTVISLIVMVALGTFGYFQIQEKLNQHDTLLQMHTKDLDQNSEFRIKYPRGELGQSSGESELFMLVEHMAGQITKMEDAMGNMMHNEVNIDRLQKDMEKVNKGRLRTALTHLKYMIILLAGISIGVIIGFSVYHYFFMDKFSCCGVYG